MSNQYIHSLVIGTTLCGKTTLVKTLIKSFGKRGIKALVLDPLNDPDWGAEFVTDDPTEFLEVAKDSTKCILVVDEGAESIGRYSGEMKWCATQARHWGHRSFFLTQGYTTLDPVIRAQCTNLFLFRIGDTHAKLAAQEFTRKEYKEAELLEQYEFIFGGRFIKPVKKTLKDFQ